MFCRAGEVHLRYLAWWSLFRVLTRAKRIVPLPPPVHGPFCGYVICTVCSVSSVRTKMARLNGRVILDCQIPNFLLMAFWPLQDCGSMAAYFFLTWMMLLAVLLLPQQHRVLLMGMWVEGSQQEKLGKLGLPMQPLHRGDHYLLCSHRARSHSYSQSINSSHPFGNRLI